MKKIFFVLLILMFTINVSALELTGYLRSPSGSEIEYSKDLPAFEYRYSVPTDVVGCKQKYGETGESIICLKSNNCDPQIGYFVAKANLGYNEIQIDCWDNNNNHVYIDDNFTTSYVEIVEDKKVIENGVKKTSFLMWILITAIMSVILWMITVAMKFSESYYKYSIFMTIVINTSEYILEFFSTRYIALVTILPIAILLIKYGYDENFKKSIIAGIGYVTLLGFLLFFFI